MTELDDETDVFVTLKMETHIIRIIGSTLIPSRLTIRCDISPVEDAEEDAVTSTLAKIKYFTEELLSHSIMFSATNEDALDMVIDDAGGNRTSNSFVLMPGEPTDELIAGVLQSKFTALATGSCSFEYVEVGSDNAIGLTFTFAGNARSVLPSVAEWVGDRHFFKECWWARNDGSTVDVPPTESEDINIRPSWAFLIDADPQKPRQSGVVLRPEFKPTVIKGGKGEPEE